jgi:hypothetical protein
MCTASNEVGTQRHPCVFHIILAGNKTIKSHLNRIIEKFETVNYLRFDFELFI